MNRTLLSFVVIFVGSGCGVLRVPASALHLAVYEGGAPVRDVLAPAQVPSKRQCMLVMLPGIGDDASRFETQGMVAAAARCSPECVVVVVDVHLAYYLSQTLVNRISTDVLHEARRFGYRGIWLVGVSLGGYGAVMVARHHPELVDGVVLIAPMLGVPPREEEAALEIADAGGLREWEGLAPELETPRHHFREYRLVWDWLRDTTMHHPERLVLAYGSNDRLSARHRLLTEAMDPSRIVELEGAHDWATWTLLWRVVLANPPWRVRRSEASDASPSCSVHSVYSHDPTET